MKQITVMHYPTQPHFFSFGGFDIQMNRIIETTNKDQIKTKKVDLWSRKESFEIAHFWGASDSHKLNIRFCKENGIKVIISGLFPQKSFKTKYKIKIWKLIHQFPHCESVIFKADIITVINDAQAEVVAKYYGYPEKQIRIIPTILDDYLFTKPTSFCEKENFVLCVGTICSRKNQIRLVQATIELGIKCVFIGRFDSREVEYKEQFLSLQNSNKGLIEHYEDISIEELCAFYEKCSLVSCISQNETEPASILEGMHFKKPIIASNLPFAKIKKFSGIILCNQNSNKSIKDALKLALKKDNNVNYNYFNSRDNSSESVIKLYNRLYQELALID